MKPKSAATHSQSMTIANIRVAFLLLALMPMIGAAKADPLPDPPPLVLPDPSPKDSHDFAPSEATRGIADPGRSLAAVKATNLKEADCNALNPCALPPPSRESAETVPSRAPAHPG
jgi:hypothetical protein